ncbi:(Fe-S)-binding protein [Amycolatopsis thermalba]|uniref:(Fe-S)-binding protein n=1 Tax=Amycolatopsis thermalba TaxID=944492 RepID=UPI000E23B2CE|nr:(Fe-S)-binding protein [Amycolatopsis thermalba]
MIFAKPLLDRCISCGYCLPACPTYAMTGEEASSPRGRISLMRALETGQLPEDDGTLAEQASFCLGCRACEPVCPAGVEYGNLLEQWRDHQWRGRRGPLRARLLMAAVARPWLLRVPRQVRRHARTAARASGPSLMLGCAERALFPRVSRAARKLAPELAAPPRQGCCGALHAHNGDSAAGARMAKELGEVLPGTIVTTSGGCATHLAAHLGRPRVRELSEFVVETDVLPAVPLLVDGRPARVALQDSCHLRNGLGVWRQPRELIRAVAEYVELPSAATCCGAAGTYSILRPRDSAKILAVKIAEIEAAGVDFVVAVNPGCLRQLRSGLRKRGSSVRAVHLAELLEIASK